MFLSTTMFKSVMAFCLNVSAQDRVWGLFAGWHCLLVVFEKKKFSLNDGTVINCMYEVLGMVTENIISHIESARIARL